MRPDVAELYQLPDDLQQILSRHAREDGSPRAADLAPAIRRLSDLFVGKIPWNPEVHDDPLLRAAYVEYFLPVNLPKIRVPFDAWLTRGARSLAGHPLRVLDVGCGPGTALVGLVDRIRSLPRASRPSGLELVGADASPEYLRHAERLLLDLAAADREVPPLRFEPLRLDLFADRVDLLRVATAGGRFDLAIAMNVLCELDRSGSSGDADRLVEALGARALHEEGAILLVEPGLRETSRALHELRDRRLAAGSLHAVAPCLHQGHCPALDRPKDWCRADLGWSAPARIDELDRATGLRKDTLKFSYVVLSPRPPRPAAPGTWRLVSEIRDLKGERRGYFCGERRWIVVGHLKRVRGPGAEVFASLRRGDLVRLDGLEKRGSILRIPETGRVRKIPEGVTEE